MASVRVCSIDELAVDQAARFVIDGIPIAVVKDSAGDIFAIGDTCTHGDISLAEGFVEGADTCERHFGAPAALSAEGAKRGEPRTAWGENAIS